MLPVAETELLAAREVVWAADTPATAPWTAHDYSGFEGTQRTSAPTLLVNVGGHRIQLRGVDPDEPWLRPTLARLASLMSLAPNWDGYGGAPVTPQAAACALQFLARVMESRTSLPSVVPLGPGGVQLEWHRGGLDVEVYVYAGGRGTLAYEEVDGPARWAGPAGFATAVFRDQLADRLVTDH